jgi:hypothetical protein
MPLSAADAAITAVGCEAQFSIPLTYSSSADSLYLAYTLSITLSPSYREQGFALSKPRDVFPSPPFIVTITQS